MHKEIKKHLEQLQVYSSFYSSCGGPPGALLTCLSILAITDEWIPHNSGKYIILSWLIVPSVARHILITYLLFVTLIKS